MTWPDACAIVKAFWERYELRCEEGDHVAAKRELALELVRAYNRGSMAGQLNEMISLRDYLGNEIATTQNCQEQQAAAEGRGT